MDKKVNEYYLSNLASLPFAKQFHYMSRLASWLVEPPNQITTFLRNSELRYRGENEADFGAILAEVISSPNQEFGAKHAQNERATYFERYPLLQSANSALFRILYTQYLYGRDYRHLLSGHLALSDLETMHQRLLNDPEALRTLSTHAVNFLYLYQSYFNGEAQDVARLWEIWKDSYNLDDAAQLLLAIYYLTHCAIGETYFYSRPIPLSSLSSYQKIADELNGLVEKYFDRIILDNKFEVLVIQKLCGSKSTIFPRVMAEAEASFSTQGDFVIDTLNTGPRADNTSFEDSEHRNVLLIMACSQTKLAPNA